jgi:predicted membrane protein
VIPLGLKVVYTIFVCALVPIYWREYGPANFLWFSDIALLALVPALWLENALLVSMLAISVVFFEALWNVDFFFRLATGKPLIGLSANMFDPRILLFIRGLSCFHIVLPLLLLWMLHGLGYDQRAFLWQTIVAMVVLPLCYLVSNPQQNVNWVYGLGEKPRRILPAPLFVVLLMLLFPLAVYLPTHLLFARIFRVAGS